SQWAKERELFVQAERAFRRKQLGKYRSLKSQLKDYPLYPYLGYAELRGRLKQAKTSEVDGFLTAFADSPMAGRLRGAWLKELERRGAWGDYLKFDRPSGNTVRRCTTGYALYKVGRKSEAFDLARDLWLVGKSQPKQCDRLFDAFKAAGALSADLVWDRFELAVRRGQSGLAKYLIRSLPKKRKPLANAWLQVRTKPGLILSHQRLKADNTKVREIISYGLSRLAREDIGAALDAWTKLETRYDFTPEEKAEAISALAIRMAREGRDDAMDWLHKVPETHTSEEVAKRAIKISLAQRDWKSVLDWVTRMPLEDRTSDQWRYWQARALEQLGEDHEARKFYAGLSLTRGYYAFMSADQIGAPYTLGDKPVVVSQAVSDFVSRMPGVLRAEELTKLKRRVDARREWRELVKRLDRVQLKAAAKLAQSWGWHDKAILTVAKSGDYDDLELRFPLVYRKLVSRHAGSRDLDMAWVFALMRQESAFAHDARSHAGAMGLMQLMPATAREVARKLRTRLRSNSQLYNPDTNIRFGTYYLRHVLDKLGNHPVLATAAYNAGPHRVKQWLPKQPGYDTDIWIELIPFNETRKYVKRIFTYTVIYEQRIGLTPTRLMDRMPPIGLEVPASAPHRAGREVKRQSAS
ncbi:MAG: transglycosylase SLT domain-containing protein, partial [Gammaproteobacteria bacterium]